VITREVIVTTAIFNGVVLEMPLIVKCDELCFLLMPAKVVNSELIVIIGMTKNVCSDWRLDQYKNKRF